MVIFRVFTHEFVRIEIHSRLRNARINRQIADFSACFFVRRRDDASRVVFGVNFVKILSCGKIIIFCFIKRDAENEQNRTASDSCASGRTARAEATAKSNLRR